MKKSISYGELMAELDKHRYTKEVVLTKEQVEFMLKCREGNRCVSFSRMAILWERLGWGKVCQATLYNRYQKLRG